MIGSNWVCPYCQRAQVVTEKQYHQSEREIEIKKHKYGISAFTAIAIGCASPECGEITFTILYGPGKLVKGLSTWSLIYDPPGPQTFPIAPSSLAKPQPSYIPKPLVEDYYEACRIRDLSPKASATLSRRVLQGMIRDFCKISKKRLVDEIDELKKQCDEGRAPPGVSFETIEAMHHLRGLGNIGAHMERDINIIVDVDPDEAQQLIELIEMLFADWYVAKRSRENRLAGIKAMAERKAEQRKPSGSDDAS